MSAVRLIRNAKVVSKRATLQLEEYRLNPPDVLWIEGIDLVPRAETYQPISGEHLVGPDGRVTLGTYGQVAVAGMTVPAAKAAIEAHLAKSFDRPQVAVSVYAYNSMVTYVVYVDAEGSQVYRLPFFGKGTVMDAVALIGNVFGRVERMALTNPQVPTLEVDWPAILNGDTSTDYPLLPDDRLVISLQGNDGAENASDAPPALRARAPEVSPYLNLLGK